MSRPMKLPVLKLVGSMYMSGDMTLALKDMKVIEDGEHALRGLGGRDP